MFLEIPEVIKVGIHPPHGRMDLLIAVLSWI
jgi:hypothetical protein